MVTDCKSEHSRSFDSILCASGMRLSHSLNCHICPGMRLLCASTRPYVVAWTKPSTNIFDDMCVYQAYLANSMQSELMSILQTASNVDVCWTPALQHATAGQGCTRGVLVLLILCCLSVIPHLLGFTTMAWFNTALCDTCSANYRWNACGLKDVTSIMFISRTWSLCVFSLLILHSQAVCPA